MYNAAGGVVSAANVQALNQAQISAIAQSVTGNAANIFADQIVGLNPAGIGNIVGSLDFSKLDAPHAAELYNAAGGLISAANVQALNQEQISAIAQSVTGNAANIFADQIVGLNPAGIGNVVGSLDFSKLDAPHAAELYNAAGGLISAANVQALNQAQISAIAQSVTGNAANIFADQIVGLNPAGIGNIVGSLDFSKLDAPHAAELYNAAGGLISAANAQALNQTQISAIAQSVTGNAANIFADQIVGLNPAGIGNIVGSLDFSKLDAPHAAEVYNAAGGVVSAANVQALNQAQISAIAQSVTGNAANIFADQIVGLNPAGIGNIVGSLDFSKLDAPHAAELYNAALETLLGTNSPDLSEIYATFSSDDVYSLATELYKGQIGGSHTTAFNDFVDGVCIYNASLAGQLANAISTVGTPDDLTSLVQSLLANAAVDPVSLSLNTDYIGLDPATATSLYIASEGAVDPTQTANLTDLQVVAIANALDTPTNLQLGAVFIAQLASAAPSLLKNAQDLQVDTGFLPSSTSGSPPPVYNQTAVNEYTYLGSIDDIYNSAAESDLAAWGGAIDKQMALAASFASISQTAPIDNNEIGNYAFGSNGQIYIDGVEQESSGAPLDADQNPILQNAQGLFWDPNTLTYDLPSVSSFSPFQKIGSTSSKPAPAAQLPVPQWENLGGVSTSADPTGSLLSVDPTNALAGALAARLDRQKLPSQWYSNAAYINPVTGPVLAGKNVTVTIGQHSVVGGTFDHLFIKVSSSAGSYTLSFEPGALGKAVDPMITELNADNSVVLNSSNSSPMPDMPFFNNQQTAAFLTNVFFSYDNKNALQYNPVPEDGSGHNSNSGIAALFAAAGFSLNQINLPPGYFTGIEYPIDLMKQFNAPIPTTGGYRGNVLPRIPSNYFST